MAMLSVMFFADIMLSILSQVDIPVIEVGGDRVDFFFELQIVDKILNFLIIKFDLLLSLLF